MTTPVDAILARLTALHPKRIDLSLDRIERLLAALGHPEQRLPPVIHVAGTNGKGSTIAFLRAMLEAAGKRVHVYTSPHLVRFNERFRLGATAEACSSATRNLAPHWRNARASTPVRRSPYSRSRLPPRCCCLRGIRPTVVLLEVGLGGRLDATNVIEHPLATVITPISIDHVEFLGRHAGRNRRRKGRHPQARRAGHRRARRRAMRLP